MIPALSGRDRRTLAAGAIVILVLVVLSRGVPAWRRWDAGVRASAAEMAAEAARAEQTVRLLPASLDSLEARRGRFVTVGGGVLEGESAAASGAALASLVSGAAGRAGVQMGSVQLHSDTASAGTFLRIGVRADATGDLPALTRMLALLEGAPELLAVREIAITQPIPGGPAEQAEALRMEITVQGLALVRRDGLPRAPAGATGDDGAATDTVEMFVDSLPAEEVQP
ncbi:type II secretion system protein GspM [Longimicrobium sp.]|uniref:type II secretion system protein GspM n=1 Tax=Longimicrobium sp. TaxID=2029185 RepID=UPI003B3ADF92